MTDRLFGDKDTFEKAIQHLDALVQGLWKEGALNPGLETPNDSTTSSVKLLNKAVTLLVLKTFILAFT